MKCAELQALTFCVAAATTSGADGAAAGSGTADAAAGSGPGGSAETDIAPALLRAFILKKSSEHILKTK